MTPLMEEHCKQEGMARIKRILHLLKCRAGSFLRPTKDERRHALVGPAYLWKIKRDFQIRFLKDMNLKPEHYLLDIGCGTLRGGIPLIDYLQTDHYFGIEVREQALNEAQKELMEAGLEGKNPTLLLSPDISQITINRKFDYIWAFSVLFHMTDKILNDVLVFVNQHLSEDGVFYGNVSIGNTRDSQWQEFPFVTRSYEFYSHACDMNGLMVSDLGAVEGPPGFFKRGRCRRMLKITK